MATLNYSFSKMRNFLISCYILFLVSGFVIKINALDTDQVESQYYHTVEISSLLPASVCSPSTIKGSKKRQSTLKVVHQHGPCSTLGQNKTPPPLTEILSNDQSRVESIHARINTSKIKNANTNANVNKLIDKKADLPVHSGRSLNSGNYIVTVGLGTPKKTLSLIFDTGSDVTWTQCQPCVKSCYKQQDPIFNPFASTSYSNVSCDSDQCSRLSVATGIDPGCAKTTCVYGIQYGDKSFSVGFFAKDKLTITATDVFPNILFGCGQNNQGLFGQTAGLLGLGRDPLSIVSQTAPKYGKYFSYCLPSTTSSTGHLTLGKNGASRITKFTPFATPQGGSSSFYFIDIVAISVGGRPLPIRQSVFKTAGGIIDSGTVITRLPPTAYNTMSAVFRKLMAKYPSAPAYSILDTCYDLSGYDTVTIPAISFTFGGNVEVKLDLSGILVVVSGSRVCLAFTGNENNDDAAIFGNTQQKTLEVVYDVAGGRLGFGPGGC